MGIFLQQERHKFRSVVGLFQFRALQGVHELRRQLADPTPDLGPSTLWITRFTGTQYTPRETPQNLRDHVGAPTGTQKRKRIPNDEAPIIDVDLWLHEARQANDDGAVQWFTRNVMHTNPPPPTANKRARHHDTLLAQATQHLTNLENLTMRHLRLVTNMYNQTHVYEQTMHHIRNLRDMYDSAITAKRKYHALQASLAQDHLRKPRTEHQYIQYCTDVVHTYDVAKQTARQLYEDGFNYLRLTRRCTIHIQYYHQLQETHHRHLQWFYRPLKLWHQRLLLEQKAYRTKQELYTTATLPIRRQLYFTRKRPREEWDPTLWEIPLLPLPKRHKPHWDLTEWELPLMDPGEHNTATHHTPA